MFPITCELINCNLANFSNNLIINKESVTGGGYGILGRYGLNKSWRQSSSLLY